MARYIDADAEIEKIHKEIERYTHKIESHMPDREDGWIDHDSQIKRYEAEIEDAEREIRMLQSYPTADVRENVRGVWIKTWQENDAEPWILWKCSECDDISLKRYNFCPNCGADMRERRE